MAVVLQVTDGPGKGRSFTFDKYDVLLLGRSGRCHCCIGDDLECSRVHLLVEINPPHCNVRDLGSKNGTFVNDNRTIEASIGPGDVVRIGQTRFSIALTQPSPEQAVATTGDPPGQNQNGGRAEYNQCARCGSSMAASPISVCPDCQEEMREIGEELPGFRIIRQIHAGGMGTIHLAEETRTARQVAVKMPIPSLVANNPLIAQLFIRECAISMGLRHPRIVEFLTAGEYRGHLYIAMEYVQGEDVWRLLERNGPMPEPAVANIGLQVLEALSYAHSQDIVHRDLKPQNVLLSGQLPNHQVKVTDFGLAKNFQNAGMSMNLTGVGDRRGTALFMPPEQVTNCRAVDHSADIFSLGAMMYFMLCCSPVFDFPENVSEPQMYQIIVSGKIVPIERRGAGVSRELGQVIDRAIQTDPAQRYQSADEMSSALRAVVR